jgi:hypothetical protein
MKWSNENIYYLSKMGAERVGGTQVKKSIQVDHSLLRNEVWLMLNKPDWQIESPVNFVDDKQKEYKIIPDALMVTDTLYCFEIDRKQSMIRNKKKLELYGILNNLYQAQYQKKIVVKYFTTLQSRKALIEQLAGEYNVVCEVYVINDI